MILNISFLSSLPEKEFRKEDAEAHTSQDQTHVDAQDLSWTASSKACTTRAGCNFPRRQLVCLHGCVCWCICRNRKKERTRHNDCSFLSSTGHPEAPPSLCAGSIEHLMFKTLHPCWSLWTEVPSTEISRLGHAWRWAELEIHWISTHTHCQQPPHYWKAFRSSCFHTDKLNASFSQHTKYSSLVPRGTAYLCLRPAISLRKLCRSHESPEKAPLPAAPRARDTHDTSALLCRATWWTMSCVNMQEKSLGAHTEIKACEHFNLHI